MNPVTFNVPDPGTKEIFAYRFKDLLFISNVKWCPFNFKCFKLTNGALVGATFAQTSAPTFALPCRLFGRKILTLGFCARTLEA